MTTTAPSLPINRIVIGERHRRDLGDIGGLAASIGELGLLQPIVVRPDGVLIAGAKHSNPIHAQLTASAIVGRLSGSQFSTAGDPCGS